MCSSDLQTLTREQYEANVATKPGSRDRVEFAIRLPGRDGEAQVWLPIDSKFPVEDYERLMQAADLDGPLLLLVSGVSRALTGAIVPVDDAQGYTLY